jgi:pantothenate synthetase
MGQTPIDLAADFVPNAHQQNMVLPRIQGTHTQDESRENGTLIYPSMIAVAAKVGNTRLIDNMFLFQD